MRQLKKDSYKRIALGLVAIVLSLGLLGSSLAGLPAIFMDSAEDSPVQQVEEMTASEIEAKTAENPKDAMLLDQLGQAYIREGNPAKAVDTYKKALALDSSRDDYKNSLAEAYVVLGSYPEAIKILQEILIRNPDHAQAHYNLGHALVGARDYRKAQSEFEEYIKLNGENNPGTEEAKRLVETLKGI
ncbi:MAG: tetratricopeptide repeat protein [Peptococcaceae bacterium]|nr:tetratricopeptide repeat protein [Peptococcaceae bacterium]